MVGDVKCRIWSKRERKMVYFDDEFWWYGVSQRVRGDICEWESMRSTGLKDKNGREIYEGDVVKWLGHEVRAGKQIRPERISTIGGKYGWITDCFFLQNIAEGNGTQEVIGNIYENPDLVAK